MGAYRNFLRKNLTRIDKIWILSSILVVGFIVSIYFHAAQADPLASSQSVKSFLITSDQYMDFINNVRVFGVRRFNTTIFPSQNLLFFVFSFFSVRTAVLLFLLVFIIALVMVGKRELFLKELKPHQNLLFLGVILFLNYPVPFALQRGNIELYLFLCVYAFAVNFKQKRYAWASFFLAFSILMKTFPGVFLVLYLREKRYKELGVLFLMMVAISATLLVSGNVSLTYQHSTAFFSEYQRDYVIGDAGFNYGHSIFALLKVCFYALGAIPFFLSHSGTILKIYLAFTLLTYFLVGLYIYLTPGISYWKQICLLTCLFCLLPYVSADYKLLHFFTPLFFYLNSDERSKYENLFLILFALILIPKSYFLYFGLITLSVILNPILISTLAVMLLLDRRKATALT